ncbi:unnamed protein product [Durusdinium trenchii]|uniref:JmjC domain-containing protein n=1 Tax=Durusdinium trenchii TaxID=1381693 RepID=A0ABP0S737_9DINO
MPSPTELEACEAAETGLPLSDARTWMHLRPKNLSALRLGGLTDDWEARSWSKEYMIRRFGQLKFRLRPCVSLHQYGYAGPADRLITLKEYLTSTFASRRCVLFENDFDAERLELLDGFAIPQLLSEIHGSPILSVGRRNTGIGFHRHSAAWLAQLQGRKLWFLLPGGRRPPERAPWQYLTHRPKRMICCVAHPGEIILVPAGWTSGCRVASWFFLLDDRPCGMRLGTWMTFHWQLAGKKAILPPGGLRCMPSSMVQIFHLASRCPCQLSVWLLDLVVLRRWSFFCSGGGSELLRKVQTSAASTAVAAARSGHLRILSHLWEKGGCDPKKWFQMMPWAKLGTKP